MTPEAATRADVVELAFLKAGDESDELRSRLAVDAHLLEQHSLEARDWLPARDRTTLLPADEHGRSVSNRVFTVRCRTPQRRSAAPRDALP